MFDPGRNLVSISGQLVFVRSGKMVVMLATYFHHGRFPVEGGFVTAEKIASVKLSSTRKHGIETV